MSNKIYYLFALALLAVAFILRIYALPNRAPFDWDQNRDYQKVENIVSGKLTLLGPIAKGDSGFYLGPLYYYLLVPGYLISSGNPISFPVTSAVIDVTFIALLLVLAYKRPKERLALILTSVVWTFSWFLIENARISWNVSLLPLYVLSLYIFMTMSIKTPGRFFVFGLISGLAWHIHASLLPFSLLPVVFFRPSSLKSLALPFVLGYTLALAPLILFDLRHATFNSRQLISFITTQSGLDSPSLSLLITDVIAKLGRNFSAIFGGPISLNLRLGLSIFILALASLFTKKKRYLILGTLTIANVLLAVMLKDLRFPEYYLAITFFPVVYLLSSLTTKLPRLAIAILLAVFLLIGFRVYDYSPASYALSNKAEIVKAISDQNVPADIRYELSPGREGGFIPLLKLAKVEIDESAPTKFVITDKLDGPVLIGGELAEDVLQSGGMRVVKYQTN
jgi:hypothetical protein